MRIPGLVAVMLLVGVTAAAPAATVPTPAQRCAAAKLKATSKRLACCLKQKQKALLKGTPEEPAKCEKGFLEAFARAEDKAALDCPSVGNAVAAAVDVDAFCADLGEEIAPTSFCGNGTLDSGEDCDSGAASPTCDADCSLAACGDGNVNAAAGEACDDGNLAADDGCSASCGFESTVVRFAALGNQGEGNIGQSEVAAAVAAKCATDGCDFVQLLGDNFYDSGVDSTTDEQWASKFETPYAAIDLPFFAILGNHDYGGEGAGIDGTKAQHQVDYSATSSKWRMPATYYRHALNHVEFFALDTTPQMFQMDAAQRVAMLEGLAQSTAVWKIAFAHHPYLSNGPHGNAGSYEDLPFVPIVNGAGVKSFMEQVVCGAADVLVSAHDASLQWLEPTCQGTELLVSGTGAKATTLEARNTTRFESLALGFLYVVVDGTSLTGEFIDTSGTVLFTRTLTRP